MKQLLLDWRGEDVAIQTTLGTSFEGMLEKVDGEIVIVTVPDKGRFAIRIEMIAVAVQISKVMRARELKIH